jgi:hypothetical protein
VNEKAIKMFLSNGKVWIQPESMKVERELISHSVFMLRPRFDKDDWEYETFSRDFRLEFLNKRVKEECIAQSTSQYRQ